jgi:hypothetical protein
MLKMKWIMLLGMVFLLKKLTSKLNTCLMKMLLSDARENIVPPLSSTHEHNKPGRASCHFDRW